MMYVQPKISVVVPVYKVDSYLSVCIKSILNQTLKDIEVIIVDEGDKDRCRDIIDYYESIDRRIIAPHQKNGGYGRSCNLGFEMATGEYVTIVESDDFLEPEMYEEMYAYAHALNADVVKTPYYEYHENGQKTDCYYRKRMQLSTPEGVCFSIKEFDDLMRVHASVWSGIYRREYMEKYRIRFVEQGAYVDVGFRIDTLIHTDRIAWLDKPYYNYRMDNPGSTTNNFNLDAMILRWEEAHRAMADVQSDYEKYYGIKLFVDEYINVIQKKWEYSITEEQYKRIAQNLSYTPDEVIDGIPEFDAYTKRSLKLLKYQPKKYLRKTYLWRLYFVTFRKYLRIPENLDQIFNTQLLLMASGIFLALNGVNEGLKVYFPADGVDIQQIVHGCMNLFLIVIALCYLSKLVVKIAKRLRRKLDIFEGSWV